MVFEKIREILRRIIIAIKKAPRVIWNILKPLPPFLLVVAILMAIALIPMAFVWGFSLEDIAFQILVIADISVLAIFVIGLIFVGLRYLLTGKGKEEGDMCHYCGEIITGGGKICTNCGRDNREIGEET